MTIVARLREISAVAGLVSLFLLVSSGFGLGAGYVASEREAFDSVLFLHRQGADAVFLRSLHHWLASVLVFCGALYLALSFLEGIAAGRRAVFWLSGGLFFVAVGFCFTGFPLPMDQNAYWGMVVRFGIVETIPLVGRGLAALLRGGATLDASTLPRLYTLHASVLPLLAMGLLGALLSQRPGEPAEGRRLHRLLSLCLVLLGLAYAFAAVFEAPLEPRADPADTSYVPRPEWYFLWLYQLGKLLAAVPWVQSLLVPALGLATLVAAPWIFTTSFRARLLLVSFAGVAWAGLTGLALLQNRDLPARPSYEQALRSRAEGLYREECQSCHGAGGRGDGSQARAFGLDCPDLTDPGLWEARSDEQLRLAIRDGQGADMPAFGEKLDSEAIEALVDLLRRRFRPARR
jgi:ubiquinol-cytochrome c reductase cytochrome b subunit